MPDRFLFRHRLGQLNVFIQPAMARPISSGESSWTKWTPLMKVGLCLEWEQLASDLGVPFSELRDLKKTANSGTGVRHATEDGLKMRANRRNYGSWVCALIEAINAARARLEPSFAPMTPHEVAEVVTRALPTIPYE